MGKKEFEKDDGECSETQKPKDVDKEVRDGNWLVVVAGFVLLQQRYQQCVRTSIYRTGAGNGIGNFDSVLDRFSLHRF